MVIARGGGGGYNVPASPVAGVFSTAFPATENPISQGGIWTRGKVEGLDWNNPQTGANADASGQAVYAGSPTLVSFDDSIAHLSQSFAANHYAQGVVYKQSGYSPVGHELELLVRFNITAHSATGYEVYWSLNTGIYIVRWNGALGDFTSLANVDGNVPVTGSVLRAEAVAGRVTVFLNGAEILHADDSTWATGHPGIGFGPYPTVMTLSSYGWSSYAAGNL